MKILAPYIIYKLGTALPNFLLFLYFLLFSFWSFLGFQKS